MTNKFKRSKKLIQDFTFLKVIVVSIILITSCSKDNYDSLTNDHKGIDENKINFYQFKKEVNIDKIEPILSVTTEISNTSKNKSQLSDFVIDTLAIKRHISSDNKTTYSFRIYPLTHIAQPNELYNLVYRKVDNKWETSIFYLKKLPKENSEHKLFEKIERIYDGKITNTLTSKSSILEMCSYETISVHCDGNAKCLEDKVCDGFACPTGQCLQRTINYISCSSGSGGGLSGSGSTSGDSGESGGAGESGGSGTNSNSYTYSPNYYENPIFENPNYMNQINRSYVWDNLSKEQQVFFGSTRERNKFFNQTIQYQIDNNWSPESKELADSLRKFKQENSAVTWEEFDELIDYLKNSTNPLKSIIAKNWINLKSVIINNVTTLLKIPCNEIPKWKELIQFIPPQSVKNKIQSLDNQSAFTDYNIQYLEHAKGAAINLDYFPVTINTLPKNPATGIKFTPTQFLNYVRLNINNFVDTNISRFSPTTLSTGYNESQIWNSSNPLGAIIHIDIPQPAGDGSVICSVSDSNHWIFTTIEVPWKPTNSNADGKHPVSGNREFGLIQNSNGTYTFYTRGVDRMTDGFESSFAENASIFVDPFANPDKLWNSLKTKVANFVQNNGGSSVTPTTSQNVIWRPDWYKVRQVLRGEVSISNLGCN